MTISRLRVNNKRNSAAGAPLENLDWSNWFTDTTMGGFYLHVRHVDGESWHRVFCRRADRPRLALYNGKLYWLVDKP